MLPVIALIGRPNVGKSTLFNRLTRSRDALVDNRPGVTRDRLYGRGRIGDKPYLVVDTGGLESEEGRFTSEIRHQVFQVIEEAQVVFFLVDYRHGLVPQDVEIANQLRQSSREIYVLVNKSEGAEPDMASSEFQELAIGEPVAISAKRGDGVAQFIDGVLEEFEVQEEEPDGAGPKIALVGRPNVGKSTLINKLVGEHRVITSDLPGTTRDSVKIPLRVGDEPYTLIDTAGVRRKARVDEAIEKFSVVKTLQAIEEANVVILTLDASSEIGSQDATIAGMIQNLGRSIVVVVNKWDRLEAEQRKKIRKELEIKLPFLPRSDILFISALYGSNIVDVMPAAKRAYKSAMVSISTSSLNRTLEDAVSQTAPPMHNQRPVRLKFAHQAGKNPPIIVVHGNQAESIPESYKKYLVNYFSKVYRLIGTPLRVIPRSSTNPFKDRNPKKVRFKKRSGRRRKL
ncbi:MAG: ribosome biogenesis GTPase Der [Gammaproteobacteria bacterium]|nr:ribosome biogenesis GTPase Der [Gammaproteobacteria bacterium]